MKVAKAMALKYAEWVDDAVAMPWLYDEVSGLCDVVSDAVVE